MYSGYLVKFGTYSVPVDKIEVTSYKAKENTQDMDSKRNENGVLIRRTLSHKPFKVEFNIRAGLTDTELSNIITSIESSFSNSLERKCSVSFYYLRSGRYITSQDMYVPDFEPVIDYIDSDSGTVYMDSMRIAAVGY